MNELGFEQKTQDGIEFYVSEDGKNTGMSINGLSRCSGVDSSTISKMLPNKEGMAKRTPKWLESFVKEGFHLLAESHDLKNIRLNVCKFLTFYFSFRMK